MSPAFDVTAAMEKCVERLSKAIAERKRRQVETASGGPIDQYAMPTEFWGRDVDTLIGEESEALAHLAKSRLP